MKVGFLHSVIRKEEKMLLEEFAKRPGVEVVMIDDRELFFRLDKKPYDVDVILERCINHSRALHALRLFESYGIRCVNTYNVATVCGDKLLTSVAFQEKKIPQPEVRVAFTEESAMKAVEEMGYPVVFKPAVGSWGRLITKINDKDAAEGILEHKAILGSYHHSIFYIQKYIAKPGRDIRAFVVGDRCIAAVYRNAVHWKTNTARGATTSNCPITPELNDLSIRAANATGGGIIALDIFETAEGLLVNEANYT
ncbi:MAG: lysine biosynthesis protein LysX, partial [Planctomycetota bacterium]